MAEIPAIHRSLVKALLELHNSRASMAIRVERGTEKKQLIVRHGLLAFAESNVRDDHLARILVRMNLLPPTSLTKIAALMKEGKSSDQAILESSDLTLTEINAGAREQACQVLASLLGWESAELHCYSANVPSKRRIDLGFALPELLVVSVRRAVAQRTIPPGLKQLKGNVALDPSAPADLLAVPLDGAEAMAYSYVQQPVSVENVLTCVSISGVKTEELLQRLLLLGFITMQDSGEKTRAGEIQESRDDALQDRLDQLLRQFEVADLYEILGVAPDVPDDGIKSAYHELARLYHPDRFQSEEFSDAIRSKAQSVFTHITGAYRTLGDAAKRAGYDADRAQKDGRVEAALKTRSALDLEREKMAEALYHSGRIALAKKQYEKAVEQLKECVWLRPDVARYRQYLGAAQIEIPKMRKEAEQHLLKAIELDCMRPETYLLLGKLYLNVNLPRRAEQQFREVLRWDPSNLEAKKLLEDLVWPGGDQASGHRKSRERDRRR